MITNFPSEEEHSHSDHHQIKDSLHEHQDGMISMDVDEMNGINRNNQTISKSEGAHKSNGSTTESIDSDHELSSGNSTNSICSQSEAEELEDNLILDKEHKKSKKGGYKRPHKSHISMK